MSDYIASILFLHIKWTDIKAFFMLSAFQTDHGPTMSMVICLKNHLSCHLRVQCAKYEYLLKRSLDMVQTSCSRKTSSICEKKQTCALTLTSKLSSNHKLSSCAQGHVCMASIQCNVGLQQNMSLHCTPSQAHRLWTISNSISDPMSVLNEVTMEPVVPPSDKLFTPDAEDVIAAQTFFREASKSGSVVAKKGVVNIEDLPVTPYPEIAFLGRSNVGKSSLIKSIFIEPKVKVSVSKKPGHTRVLKFYHVSRLFSLVDMPGYGYNMPEYFVESMEEYLKTRKQLTKVFLLIDGRVGLQPADEIAIEMMEEFSKPYMVVFTKIDKAQPSQVLNHLLAIRKLVSQDVTCCFPQPFLTSSTQDWGIGMLQSFITYITGAQKLASVS